MLLQLLSSSSYAFVIVVVVDVDQRVNASNAAAATITYFALFTCNMSTEPEAESASIDEVK